MASVCSFFFLFLYKILHLVDHSPEIIIKLIDLRERERERERETDRQTDRQRQREREIDYV